MMFKKLFIVFILLLMFCTPVVNAQGIQELYPVYGYVKDATGEPISGATVTLTDKDGNSAQTTTNSNGEYVIDLSTVDTDYEQGDKITVTALYNNNEGSTQTIVDTSSGGSFVNVTLGTVAAVGTGLSVTMIALILVIIIIIAVVVAIMFFVSHSGKSGSGRYK